MKWLTKEVSLKEWFDEYSKNPSYCLIEKNERAKIGFMGTILTEEISLASNEDMRIIDEYRRRRNIRPFVLETK